MDEVVAISDLPAAAPATVDEFRARLAEVIDDLPRRLRQCAEYIAANTDRIAVSTVAELAAGADVPPSALMRFCQILGFSGFSEMQRLFREAYSPGWPDYSTRLKNLKEEGAGSPAALLAEFIEAGRLSLEALAKSADEVALAQAVNLLETYLKAQPGDGQAITLLASAHMALGRHAKATALMQETLKTQDNPAFRTALGISLLGSGQTASGTTELESAYKKDPRQTQAGTALVQLYLRGGQSRKAIPVASR